MGSVMSLRLGGGLMVAIGIVSLIIGIVLAVRQRKKPKGERSYVFTIILIIAGIVLALIGGILLARSQSV